MRWLLRRYARRQVLEPVLLVTRDTATGKFIRVGPAMAKRANEETIEVWERDPNVHALTDLLNRALDKPTEHTRADVTVHDWEKRAARLAAARNRAGR